jgi:fatty acid desaturase
MTMSRGAVQERNASDYSDLLAEVKAAGLLDRRYRWYVGRVVVLAALFATAVFALFALGPSPLQLLVAAGLGVLFTQSAFLAHDGAHRQVFRSGARNEWFARIVGNAVVGLSYGWWMSKHTRHHAHPNQLGRDGDISSGALVMTPDAASERTGIPAALMRRQHWFFLPILLLAGIDLHITAVKAVLGGEQLKHPVVEAVLLAVRLLGFPVLAVLAAGPGMGAALVAVELAVFGVYMGGSFAPNHKGMPIVPPGMTIDFLRRQTLMSRNISGGLPMAIAMGGLNYQIEHHLFPSMPSVNLRRARPLVRAYCADRGIRYSETTFVGSYRIVLRYLKRVGLRHADPFECPLAAQYR